MGQPDRGQWCSLLQDTPISLVERVELLRLEATSKLDSARQSEMGQFLTPAPTARLLASMFEPPRSSIHLLDAGAGVGALSAAYVARVCQAENKPEYLSITGYELDPELAAYLNQTFDLCRTECERVGIFFTAQIMQEDFIEAGVRMLAGDLLSPPIQPFNCAILNPPYRKIKSNSRHRQLLSRVSIETTNLYTAFLWLASSLLASKAELVAITPRSFCNGSYFRKFRSAFLNEMQFRQVHVFEARDRVFKGDAVLQENIVFCVAKDKLNDPLVNVSSSIGPEDESMTVCLIKHSLLIRPEDPDQYIRIVTDSYGQQVASRMTSFECTLEELGISVSTGRVVDFRAARFLRANPSFDTVPLIYAGHLVNSSIVWPRPGYKKPNAIVACDESDNLLVPSGIYVLTKRFTAKEESRRIVAAVFHPDDYPYRKVGFENHLNYYHRYGVGLPEQLAWGLTAFLNSTLVDQYFRQFNGHTQVNSHDLRSLRYPNSQQLELLGEKCKLALNEQDKIDDCLEALFAPSE